MIDMPPRRTLPPQLRDKLLVRLREKMDRPPRRSRTPYAVAAGVAALVAGGVVVATTLHGGTAQPAGTINGMVKGVEDSAQRCLDASVKVGGFPQGANWRVVVHTSRSGFVDLAFKVDGKPVFCETTTIGVTLSKFDAKPTYVPGTRTGVVTETPGHMIGVIVDPSWRGVDGYAGEGAGRSAMEDIGLNSPYAVEEDMIIWSVAYPFDDGYVAPHGDKKMKPLPKVHGEPGITVIDRPSTVPAVDRTSPQAKFLAKCNKDNVGGGGLPDPDTWQPGAWVTGDDETVLAIRGVDSVTFCFGSRSARGSYGIFGIAVGPEGVVRLPVGDQPVITRQSREYIVHDSGTGPETMHGVLWGSVSLDAASMVMTTDTRGTLTAVVRNGTFVADFGHTGETTDLDPVVMSVVVKNAQGQVIYQGKPAR